MLVSCNSISKVSHAKGKESFDIAGIYQNNTDNRKNIVDLLDRKLLKDTLYNKNIQTFNRFSIEQIDRENLEISLYQGEERKIVTRYKYKKYNASFLLKNKNTKTLGVPFLFGRFDVKKLYLSKNLENNLQINVIEQRAGAALLIVFLDWTTNSRSIIYKNIEK